MLSKISEYCFYKHNTILKQNKCVEKEDVAPIVYLLNFSTVKFNHQIVDEPIECDDTLELHTKFDGEWICIKGKMPIIRFLGRVLSFYPNKDAHSAALVDMSLETLDNVKYGMFQLETMRLLDNQFANGITYMGDFDKMTIADLCWVAFLEEKTLHLEKNYIHLYEYFLIMKHQLDSSTSIQKSNLEEVVHEINDKKNNCVL